MFEGNKTMFKVPLNKTKNGCELALKYIPLADHLSPCEMETLLFIRYEDDPELRIRIDLNIYGVPNRTNFWRSMNSFSISTAGYTEGNISVYI